MAGRTQLSDGGMHCRMGTVGAPAGSGQVDENVGVGPASGRRVDHGDAVDAHQRGPGPGDCFSEVCSHSISSGMTM